MAIGKVNAYATIQAPNVDFGDIALNAQKFQEADLERQKELKLAQLKAEKPKPFVFKPEVLKEDSGLNWFNISQRETVANTMQEYFELSKKNEAGELDAEGGSKLQALEQNIQNADKTLKSVGGHYENYIKGIKDHSGAFKVNEEYLQGFTADNGQNVLRTNDSNGNPYFQQVEVDSKTKKPIIGNDGKPVIKKFVDKNGVERDGWGYADILSGRAFEPLNAFDDQKFATDVAKLVTPYKTGSDTGITKIVRETLTPSNINTINTMIETQVLNNRDHLVDVLYKLDPVKYKEPRAEYTKEDVAFAKLGMEKSIYGGVGLSSVTDVNLDLANKEKERKALLPILTLAPEPIHGLLNDNIINKKKGIYSFPGKTTLPGNIDMRVVLDAKEIGQQKGFNRGDLVTVPAGSSIRQLTFDKNGMALGKVSFLNFKNQTLSPDAQAQMLASFNSAVDSGASEGELQVKARQMGANYQSVWGVIPTAAANEINYGGGETLESLKNKMMKSQPKSKKPKKGILD
jgi:hypothetical protein